MQMDKILIEVNKDSTGGTIDMGLNDTPLNGEQLMYAACMLIDTLLSEEIFTLDEVLAIVKDIPNAGASDEHSQLWN